MKYVCFQLPSSQKNTYIPEFFIEPSEILLLFLVCFQSFTKKLFTLVLMGAIHSANLIYESLCNSTQHVIKQK